MRLLLVTFVMLGALAGPERAHACIVGHIDLFTQALDSAGIGVIRSSSGWAEEIEVLSVVHGDPAGWSINVAQRPRPPRRNSRGQRVIMLDEGCGSQLDAGVTYLAFLTREGTLINAANDSLIEIEGPNDPLVETIRALLSASPEDRREYMLQVAAREARHQVRRDAAQWLAMQSAELGDRAESRIAARALVGGMSDELHLVLLAESHDLDSFHLFEMGRARRLLPVLLNREIDTDDPDARQAWLLANLGRDWREVVIEGFQERGHRVESVRDLDGLNAIVADDDADMLSRVVAWGLCARVTGQHSAWWVLSLWLRGGDPRELRSYVRTEACTPLR